MYYYQTTEGPVSEGDRLAIQSQFEIYYQPVKEIEV